MDIHYHPGKANVVADALSRRSYCSNVMIQGHQPELYEEFEALNLELIEQGTLAAVEVHPTLEEQIKTAQEGHTGV